MTKPLALIVEDDPQLSRIFSVTLKSEFTVETATDGNSALARLAQIVPDIIVLDLHLPGKSGADILAAIRADSRLVKSMVILATADARQAETLADQADIVLLKPVSPVQLRALASRLRSSVS